ncbi:MAG: hypothetical protein WKF48_05660 [Solirubrobacteraceae bacterium]
MNAADRGRFYVEAWERRLAFAVSLHRMVQAGHALTGGQGQTIEATRLDVVAVLDEAAAAGVTEAEQDAAITRINEAANA